jgi:hypothetical protein
MDPARASGQPNENENGVQETATPASAGADEALDLDEGGGRGEGRLGRDDLADRRAASPAHAPGAAGARDLLHGPRTVLDRLADGAIRDALAVADDQALASGGRSARAREIMPQMKMVFNIIPKGLL